MGADTEAPPLLKIRDKTPSPINTDNPLVWFDRFDVAMSRGHLDRAQEAARQLRRFGYRVSTCRPTGSGGT